MNNTTLQIKLKYDEMGKAEKKIADWLSQNPGEIIPLSIVELAEKCDCSEATIVRFAKRLGFSGYQGLKISLAQEHGTQTVNTDITGSESCFEIYEKMCQEIYMSLEKTKKSLSGEELSRAAEKIMSASKIVIFGLGNSASIAVDAAHKLLRAGCGAVAYTDNHMQSIAASQLTENDVAIGISHSGSSTDIVDALKIAKSNSACTICITSKGKSPIIKVSDIKLRTDADETKYSILALNSRIAQLAIIDTRYTYIVSRLDQKALKAIEATEAALLTKKY